MLYWLLKLLVVRPLIDVFCKPWVEGEQHVPTRGPAIIVANHLSAGETVLVPAMLRRRLTFPAKIELFEGAGLKGRLLGLFMRGIGQRPMDRSGGRASASGMDSITEVLASGGLVAIFPEGTRSPDGRLYKGKTGAARLVLAAGVPVVPVGLVNTQLVKSRLGIPYMRRPGVIIGPPLDFSAYAHAGNHRDSLRWVTDEMMNAIMELSGQTYVDAYAASVKSALAEGRELVVSTPPRPGFGRARPEPPAKKEPAAHPARQAGTA